MKKTTLTKKHHGRYLPWAVGSAAFLGLTGTLWALSEVLENDSDGDGWIDTEEIIAGTDPADETDPWDSDGDGIADYLEFLDGTDPLDPNDPPHTHGRSFAYSVAATASETDPTLLPVISVSLPSPTWASQKNMWHNTAWFGERLNYVFYTPAADSKWQAFAGTEIEYWSPGYYDLLARNGSKGIVIMPDGLIAKDYKLKWKHMKRPDGGEPAYSVVVKIGDEVIASQNFSAPECEKTGGGREISMSFALPAENPKDLKIVFMPSGSGTSGPLVGSIALEQKPDPEFEIVPVVEEGIIEGPYEISRTTITLSGTVGDDFSKNFTFSKGDGLEIPDGNLIELSVTADDSASVSIGGTELSVTANGSTQSAQTQWRSELGDRLPLTLSYSNVGATYNLSIVITVKKSLRTLRIDPQALTAYQEEWALTINDDDERKTYKKACLVNRSIFGSGEYADIRIIRKSDYSKLPWEGSEDVRLGENIVLSQGKRAQEMTIRIVNVKDETSVIEVSFPDGEILSKNLFLKVPESEFAKEISEDEYLDLDKGKLTPIDYKGKKYRDGHYYLIQVYPINVSFKGVYHWEDEYPEEVSGIFSGRGINIEHTPAKPCQLNEMNCCSDKAFFAADFNEKAFNSYMMKQENILGQLIWRCPVRWNINNPGTAGENLLLPATGSLPTRIQTTTLRKNEEGDDAVLTVEKLFSRQGEE